MEDKLLKITEKVSDLVKNKDYKEAEKEYKQILEDYPGHEGAREGLGRLYVEIGEDEKAKEYIDIEKVNEENQENSIQNTLKLISSKIELKNYKKAVKEYLELLGSYPEHEGIREGLGKLYLEMGEEEKAKEFIDLKEINNNDSDDDIISSFQRLNQIIKSKDYKKAVKEYLELLESYPEHQGIKAGLGKLYIEMGEEEKAKEFIDLKEINNNDSDDDIKKKFDQIKDIMNDGDFIKAENEYKELLKKYPEHVGIKEALDNFYIEKEKNDIEEEN